MKEYPITFAVQEVPEDPFYPDGDSIFRGVARIKPLDVTFAITGKYESAEEVLAEVSTILRDGNWKINTLAWDLNRVEDKNFISREQAYDLAYTVVSDHTAAYRHKQ